ncbi:MAG: sugar ABC transporter permease [Chloroflexi bacterium]|nr:sugar ABC transporter permease [Chloroflexota bacterium]
MQLRRRWSRWWDTFNIYHKHSLWGLAFVLPGVLFFIIFAYYPVLRAAQLSLTDYNLLSPPRYIGLGNYQFIFQEGSRFYKALVNTFEFVGGYAIPMWILALALALIFTQDFRGRGVYRTLYFVPIVLSETVISIVWRLIYHPQGIMNAAVAPLTGGVKIPWLTDSNIAPIALIIVAIWRVFGYYMIIFITGLQNIPGEYYDAAKVDGANRWQVFRFVTMPLLRPTTVFVVVITLLNGFQSFVYQFLITRGGPNDATTTLGYLIYEEAFPNLNMGRAAAISMVLFAMLIVLTFIQLYLLRQRYDT